MKFENFFLLKNIFISVQNLFKSLSLKNWLDRDEINRGNAKEQLGENYTEEQYKEWLEEQGRNGGDMGAEGDFMPDDDGDQEFEEGYDFNYQLF